MKPVLIQNLIRNMRKTARLPMPAINDAPARKDKSGTFVMVFVILVLLLTFILA
jgi:hypothetical protein